MTYQSECTVVFGGSGFIGSHLLARLTADGVRRVISADIAAPQRVEPGVEYIELDVRRPLKIPGCHPDVVFNLAAIHKTPGHADAEYYDTNVAGALNVLEFCETHRATVLVFTSSISVYGPSETMITESSPLRPNSAYGKSKAFAESIQLQWTRKEASRKLVIARPAVIFGAGEGGNFERMRRAMAAHRFVYPGRRDTIKACGYVGELIRCFDWALRRPEPELLFNFAYPERSTIEDIARAMSMHAGLREPNLTVPTPVVKLIQRFGNYLDYPTLQRLRKLTESTNVYPAALVEQDYLFETDLDSGIALWLSPSS